MCLILFAWQAHSDYPLIVAANRDEFHTRPTAALEWWADAPHILAGRDLQRGGTWLGMTQQGRFAALTNYREPQQAPSPQSRGELVSNFMHRTTQPRAYLNDCQSRAAAYNGFNLLAGDQQQLYYYSNRLDSPQTVAAGVHGLSNHVLDTPWRKVQLGIKGLTALIQQQTLPNAEVFFALLQDRSLASDAELPNTGVPLAWERLLSAMFIISPDYGTRSSTVLLVNDTGEVEFYERSFAADGTALDTRRVQFSLCANA